MIENDGNNISKNSIQIKLKSIFDKIVFDKTYEEGKNKLIEYFKIHISNKKIVNNSLKEINRIILKGNSSNKILSIIPVICELNPNSFINNIDIILSIFQNCIKKEENSSLYSQMSQCFGDACKILLNDLDLIANNENEENNNNTINNLLLKSYNKFKIFCISNMDSDNINCQICGTLCLTSFIENCSL